MSIHVGIDGYRRMQQSNNLVFIKRVQDEYFKTLQGKGGHTLARVFANKILHFLGHL